MSRNQNGHLVQLRAIADLVTEVSKENSLFVRLHISSMPTSGQSRVFNCAKRSRQPAFVPLGKREISIN
jgi:hypothetical protein